MKKQIIMLALMLGIGSSRAQSTLADFENFSLPPNSAYTSSASVSFSTTNAWFRHSEGGGFWSGGFAYTNKLDSSTAGFTNLYGVRAYKGYNASNYWVVGQDGGIIKLKAPANSVDGFYVTNTTYAWKSMKSGDQFAKKFGGVSGNDSDYFKIVIKGYLGGSIKNDSVTFMLADFTFTNNANDYIVNTWQYVNTSTIGMVDSIRFVMRSSDMSGGFINTPTFFALDNFSTQSLVGLNEFTAGNLGANIFPNPASEQIHLSVNEGQGMNVTLRDVSGKILISACSAENIHELDLRSLSSGIYFLEIRNNEGVAIRKIIKE